MISVFPNPASDDINFSFASEQKRAELKLFDLTGREVKSISFSGKQVTLKRENLDSGIYIYRCVSENKPIGSGKIIIM